MAELDAEQLSFNNAQDLVVLSDTIVYYLNVKMAAMDKNANFRVPGAMEKIIELARTLPSPTPEEWGSLAVGRISTKRKFKGASSGEDNRSKTRAKCRAVLPKSLPIKNLRLNTGDASERLTGRPRGSI